MSLDRFTRTPFAPAADPRVTVPVAFACPPTTVEGAMPSPEMVPSPADDGFKVNPAPTLFADWAVIARETVLPTTEVVTVKVPEV